VGEDRAELVVRDAADVKAAWPRAGAMAGQGVGGPSHPDVSDPDPLAALQPLGLGFIHQGHGALWSWWSSRKRRRSERGHRRWHCDADDIEEPC